MAVLEAPACAVPVVAAGAACVLDLVPPLSAQPASKANASALMKRVDFDCIMFYLEKCATTR